MKSCPEVGLGARDEQPLAGRTPPATVDLWMAAYDQKFPPTFKRSRVALTDSIDGLYQLCDRPRTLTDVD